LGIEPRTTPDHIPWVNGWIHVSLWHCTQEREREFNISVGLTHNQIYSVNQMLKEFMNLAKNDKVLNYILDNLMRCRNQLSEITSW